MDTFLNCTIQFTDSITFKLKNSFCNKFCYKKNNFLDETFFYNLK